uniref:protein sel-1 homolog 3 n=1 Tax=Solea senegalensis TaxID=28829 RepID=UPI001CD86D09|nr:protein sel-1 homolog 3 [Solea senegalensis]
MFQRFLLFKDKKMNVFHVIVVAHAFTAAVLKGESVSQSGQSLRGDFLEFTAAADRVPDDSVVHVRYRCSRPCGLTVEAVVSTLRKKDVVIFRRTWISSTPAVDRTQRVALPRPPSISDTHGLFNGTVTDVGFVTVRAWLDHLREGGEAGTYQRSMWRIYRVLTMMATKPPTECPSWFTQLKRQITRDGISQCPHESDVIDMLDFPLASTGENFGAIRRFKPFIDESLERVRRQAVTEPSVTISVWIYVVERCQEEMCGIIHHVDRANSYGSVMMQLTHSGDVIIQARLTTGEDEAFRARAALPLWKWIRLDCSVQDSKVLLDTTWEEETIRHIFQFQDSIYYDDTDGYFVVGGGKYMPGIHGYFGPVRFYRLGAEEINNPLHPETTLKELDRTHHECREMKAFTEAFLKQVTNRGDASTSHFRALWGQFDKNTCTQTWSWETTQKYNTLFQLLQTQEEKLRTGSLRTTLFQEALDSMFSADQTQMNVTTRSASLLQAASCFGNHRATLLLASVHLAGLGRGVDHTQGHVYSLIGASADDRFALMHAGYKHSQGLDGFPKRLDMAYSYYSNAGAQSSVDAANIHDTQQYTPEHIYLSNTEDLNTLMRETSDTFHYLTFKAERGDADAQRRLGAMLYWGQTGISKDIESAVKWFARSSMQMKDPSAMYDYSILLMKGEGVKRNKTRGFQLLKKAAAMGSVTALNALGWYHGIELNDHEQAVKYFEQAARSGSADAMFNLGLYHLSGTNPRSLHRDEKAAFRQFLNASRSGHVGAAVEAAWFLSSGCLEGVSQDVERAVIMLKKVCDVNGHLGFMIREALQAFLHGSWREAFVRYVLAAETGLGLAQSNAAHLCEELNLHGHCQWRYHNYSVFNYDPHPSALLRMGDFYFHQKHLLWSVAGAAWMYSRAAAAGSPQGIFNLVTLAQQGHALPPGVYAAFNTTCDDDVDVAVEKMLKRCVEAESDDAATPCSLALLQLQVKTALRRMHFILVNVSLLSVCVLVVFMPLQSWLEQRVSSRRAAELRARTTSGRGEERGIMGVSHRVVENQRLNMVNGERWLRQTSDFAVTLSGVCVFVFCTAFLTHFL